MAYRTGVPPGITLKFSFDPKTVADVEAKAKGYSGRAAMGIKRVVRQTVAEMTEEARNLAAVDTGFMQANISHTEVEKILTAWVAFVISKAHYSIFVEYGTYKMRAQPFMRPVFEKYAPIFAARVKAVLANTR